MSETTRVLDYAAPVRRPSAWLATEAWLAGLANATLAVLLAGAWVRRWEGLEGLAAGLFVAAFALILTVTFVAACGVYVETVDGPTTAARRRSARWVFGITLGHLLVFVLAVGGAVAVYRS